VEITSNSDGGANLTLSRRELAGYFNLLSQYLNETTTWTDGTPIPPEISRPLRVQLDQLASALGRPDFTDSEPT
jgi:hypothetical protein